MRESRATVYPPDALAGRVDLDVIPPSVAATLDGQFRERVRRSAERPAYCEFDAAAGCWRDYTWSAMADEVARWQAGLRAEGLRAGDRVAIRLRNCRHWVILDQAALGLGLVVVPLYVADRPDNVNFVLDHSESRLLLLDTEQAWRELDSAAGDTSKLKRVILLHDADHAGTRAIGVDRWLPDAGSGLAEGLTSADDLASLVYTSGTTGRPKGVMLSHRNMVANAYSGLRSVAVAPDDTLLSFLPLSHTLERTVGYYVAVMSGARVAFNRSIPVLPEDLLAIRPTGIITVPRIFERVYGKIKQRLQEGPVLQRWLFHKTVEIGWRRFEHRQGRARWSMDFLLWPLLDLLVARKVRARLGGRLRLAVVGGAPCPVNVSRVFISLGINLLQGYGLTESSPSVSINTLRRNLPSSIGLPLHDVEVRIGANSELLVRGPNVMLGYWKDEDATRAALDAEGWLHTGDQAKIENGFISITGRLKDILVLANGEKVAPADMELAIMYDPLFEHCMVVGEHMPYLSALVVLDARLWHELAAQLHIKAEDRAELNCATVEKHLLARIAQQVHEFPGYARICRVSATLDPWTVEEGLLTPTLKMKRNKVLERHRSDIERMYEGHDIYAAGLVRSA